MTNPNTEPPEEEVIKAEVTSELEKAKDFAKSWWKKTENQTSLTIRGGNNRSEQEH